MRPVRSACASCGIVTVSRSRPCATRVQSLGPLPAAAPATWVRAGAPAAAIAAATRMARVRRIPRTSPPARFVLPQEDRMREGPGAMPRGPPSYEDLEVHVAHAAAARHPATGGSL